MNSPQEKFNKAFVWNTEDKKQESKGFHLLTEPHIFSSRLNGRFAQDLRRRVGDVFQRPAEGCIV